MSEPETLPAFRGRLETLYAPRAPGTRRKVREVLSRLEALGVAGPAGLTPELAARFAASLPGNPNTARGLLGYLRTVYRVAREDRLIPPESEPNWARLRPAAVKPTRNPCLTRAEVARLLGRLESDARDFRTRRISALASLVAYTGLRRDEALYLRRGDYDYGRGLVRVTGRDRAVKTPGSARAVPAPDRLREALAGWLPWCAGSAWLFPGVTLAVPWVGGAARDRPLAWLQRAARAAGLGRVTWHGLRHSFATIALRDWGLPLWAVSKVLGHSSIRTTERYLHLDDPEALLAAVRARPVGF